MQVLYKKPAFPPEVIEVENELKPLQKLVNGYLETITVNSHMVMVLNEEGRLRNMVPNFYYKNELIVGPVFFCGVTGDGFRDITGYEIRQAEQLIRKGYKT